MHNVISTPLIKGKEIHLVPFHEEHLTPRYVNWLNTPENVKYSELRHKVHSHESCIKYLESMIANKNFFWALIHSESMRHIGNMSAYIDRHNGLADLAILIGEADYRGKGYGLSTWMLACDSLLENGIRKVTAGTMSINEPMLKIFRNSGMEIEAVRKNHYLWNDQSVDIILAAKARHK